jgi:hypothetical protein
MKTITISGKNNKYQMKKIVGDERDVVSRKFELDESFYMYQVQVDIIKYMNNCEQDIPLQYVDAVPVFTRNIKDKLSGYLSQDRIQERVDDGVHITFKDTVKKLIESEQKCYYCSEKVLLLYNIVRDTMQWTLDRIDNNIRHSCGNVVISCLGCNLAKRRRGAEAFRTTKQMVLHKCDDEEDTIDNVVISDIFEDIIPDVNDHFFQSCSNIEYSYDT